MSLRACEAISLLAVVSRPCFCHCEPAVFCHCERSAAISLFSVCQPWKTEIASCLAMTGVLSLRACEAISLLSVCPPQTTEIATFLATPRGCFDRSIVIASAARLNLVKAPLRGCEPAKQSLFWLLWVGRVFVIASEARLNLVKAPLRGCQPAKQSLFALFARPRQPRSPRPSRHPEGALTGVLSLRACEAISLLSVCRR